MNNRSNVEFIYLADQPHLLPVLAEWFYEEWGRHNPQSSLQSIKEELGGYLHTDRIPLAIVCLQDSRPVASASLRIREMESHPQYMHWLGGVYVLPDNRGHQIGSRLVEFTAAEAQRLNVRELFLYTRTRVNFYARLGWQVIEEPVYKGKVVSIMKRNLILNK